MKLKAKIQGDARTELDKRLNTYTGSAELEELISNEHSIKEAIDSYQESGAISNWEARNYRALVLRMFWSYGLYKLFPEFEEE